MVISTNNRSIAFLAPLLLMMLVIAVFFAWFYALGTNLYKKLPPTVNMSLVRFKIFLFIPVAYILFICVFLAFIFSNVTAGNPLNPLVFLFIVPLHLFSIFCIFYSLYFIAKTLKAVEWQKPVTFNEFAGEFFLIWFFPIGIWFIQPRINKLFGSSPKTESL